MPEKIIYLERKIDVHDTRGYSYQKLTLFNLGFSEL